ncbi:MAG: hypothetical protein ACRED3_14755, partial [Bradyrhizobium sp.]
MEQFTNALVSPSAVLDDAVTADVTTAFDLIWNEPDPPTDPTFSLLFRGAADDGSDDSIFRVTAIAGSSITDGTWEKVGAQDAFVAGAQLDLDHSAEAVATGLVHKAGDTMDGPLIFKGPGDENVALSANAFELILLNPDDDTPAAARILRLHTDDGSYLGDARLHIHSATDHYSVLDLGDDDRVTLVNGGSGLLVVCEGASVGLLEDVDDLTLGRIRAAEAINPDELLTLGQLATLLADKADLFGAAFTGPVSAPSVSESVYNADAESPGYASGATTNTSSGALFIPATWNGAGNIGLGSLDGWSAFVPFYAINLRTGEIIEVSAVSSSSITIPVGGRGKFGTTPAATLIGDIFIVVPVIASDAAHYFDSTFSQVTSMPVYFPSGSIYST